MSTQFAILSSLIRVYTICHSQQSDQGLHCFLFSAVWSGSTLFAILSKQFYQGLHCFPFLAIRSGSTSFTILSSLIRVYTVAILSSLVRDYTICYSQSDQRLHYLLFSAVWSGSTLFAILSMQHYQGLHCLPFSAFWSESTLLAIRSSLMKVKVYTVILMNNLIRVYTICHSQQSGQGLHYLPFLAVWSRSGSTLSFSGTVWSGSTLFVILKSVIWVYTVCRSQ